MRDLIVFGSLGFSLGNCITSAAQRDPTMWMPVVLISVAIVYLLMEAAYDHRK